MSEKNLNEYINLDSALKRMMGNKDIYKKLLTSYKNSNYMSEFTEEVNNDNFESAAKMAHTIKGLTSNLSFDKMYKIIAKMESLLKEKISCKELLQECEAIAEKTNEYVDHLLNIL